MSESAIFNAAVKLPLDQRPGYLDQACGVDAQLRADVESLLRAHDTSGFLDEEKPSLRQTESYRPLAEGPGTVIGPYKLMEQIGEGGMGLVFVAEQQQPVRRKVALKVIKPGMDTRQVIARFEAERQALALMDHPNIARVLDGGETTSGRPYFVMELVKGMPITEYCDRNQVPIRERLQLFSHVCQAVQHAHQKGIIHRDLKPSNVLVVSHDGVPVIKVIDFGVAKAVGQQLTDKTIYTQFAQMVGTPLYMSPEQAGQSGLDVDTRTDIYALGVLLYELLTGQTPFDKERFRQAAFDEIRRIIREEEPPRPSTRISTLGETSPAVSTQRKSDPKQLSRLFRGELDWMVMKALEKDRNRRYETASAFAADVSRYLADEPVQACPPSAAYRFRKFARRNRSALALTGAALLVIAVLVGGAGWFVRDRAAREQAFDTTVDRSLSEAESLLQDMKWPEARTTTERTEKLLEAAGRKERSGRLLELQKNLAMIQRLDDIYARPKDVLYFTAKEQDASYARAFQEYGIDMAVLPVAEAVTRIRSSQIHLELARACDLWSGVRRTSGNAATPDWKQLLAFARAADPDPWRNRLRDALETGRRETLEELARSADVRQLPPGTLHRLGHALKNVGALDLAVALMRRAQRQYPGDFWINQTLADFYFIDVKPTDHHELARFASAALALRPDNPHFIVHIGMVLKSKGNLDEALATMDKAVEVGPGFASTWNGRGIIHGSRHEHEKALADYSKAIEVDPNWVWPWINRSTTYANLSRWNEALADATKAIQLDPAQDNAWNERGRAHLALRHHENALADISKAIEIDPKDARYWDLRGTVHHHMHQDEKAVSDHTQAIELDPKSAVYWNNRSAAHGALNQWEKALADSAKAIELDPKNAAAWCNHGRALTGLKQFDQALADHTKAIDLDPKRSQCWANRGYTYSKLREFNRALDDCSRALELDLKDPGTWNTRGLVYRELHDYASAVADLTKAIELEPERTTWWHHRGCAYLGLRQWNKALADFNKVIDLNPNIAGTWQCRGLTYFQMREYPKALADSSRAIELDPKLGDAWLTRGDVFRELRQYDKSLADLNQAVELDPGHPACWQHRGRTHDALRQWDQAVADYSKAIDLDPKNSVFWGDRALARENLGQWDKALADHSKALELNPNEASFWGNRGVANTRLQQWDQAIADYSRALELAPDSPSFQNNLAWSLSIHPESAKRDSRRALELAEKAVKADPKQGTFWVTLGVARFRIGNALGAVTALQEALKLLEGVNQFEPRVGRAMLFLAMAQQKAGHSEEARQTFERTLAWLKANQQALEQTAWAADEMRRHRAEAEEVLGMTKGH